LKDPEKYSVVWKEWSETDMYLFLPKIGGDLIEAFNSKHLRIGDGNSVEEQVGEVLWEKFVTDLKNCKWYGPFDQSPNSTKDFQSSSEHFYCFTVNETGDNHYYLVLEIELRD
jgi:hypothetical protein